MVLLIPKEKTNHFTFKTDKAMKRGSLVQLVGETISYINGTQTEELEFTLYLFSYLLIIFNI